MQEMRTVFLVCLLTATSFVMTFAQSPTQADEASPGNAAESAAGLPEQAEGSAAALAKKLANPIAAMISVPFQNNFDAGMGPSDDGYRYTMNFQPVVPIPLSANWNLISRTIVPFIHQSDVVGTSSQTGTGDILQSLIVSPKRVKRAVWGVGPIFLIPSATHDSLGAGKLAMGTTMVVLKQHKGWTGGALLWQLWSVAGDHARPDVNTTFLQPFFSFTTRTAWTIGVNTESTYDWTAEQWATPIHLNISKLVHFGTQPMSFGAGPRCWAASPAGGPRGCAVRFTVTALFPRRPS